MVLAVVTHRANEQLTELRAALTLGMSQSEVEETFRSAHYDELTLSRQGRDTWIINTPMEFGASNWCLDLTFTDNLLNGVVVRFVDDPTQVLLTPLPT